MTYVIIGVALVFLFLLVRLFKFINGPKIEKLKLERRQAWFDFRQWRISNRRWNRRRQEDEDNIKLN